MSYQALANQFKINNPSPIVRRQLILKIKEYVLEKHGLKASNLYIYKFRREIKADKEKSTEKIDGVIAMVSNKV